MSTFEGYLDTENSDFLVCKRCGAYVYWGRITEEIYGFEVHNQHHNDLARVADDAHWGGFNRPIG